MLSWCLLRDMLVHTISKYKALASEYLAISQLTVKHQHIEDVKAPVNDMFSCKQKCICLVYCVAYKCKKNSFEEIIIYQLHRIPKS